MVKRQKKGGLLPPSIGLNPDYYFAGAGAGAVSAGFVAGFAAGFSAFAGAFAGAGASLVT